MLALLTAIAARALLRTCLTFSSIPTANMKRQTPILTQQPQRPERIGGKYEREGARRDAAEQRRPEQDARGHLSDDGGKAEDDGGAAGDACGRDDDEELKNRRVNGLPRFARRSSSRLDDDASGAGVVAATPC
jgi:hypothetical protein